MKAGSSFRARVWRSVGVAAVLLWSASSLWAQAVPPNTPAGRVLAAWLEAINTGDRVKLEQFRQTYKAPEHVDAVEDNLHFFQRRGGFDLVSVHISEPTHLEYVLNARGDHTRWAEELDVNDADPPSLIRHAGLPVPPDAVLIGYRIDRATRNAVIKAAAAKLQSLYVFPAVGETMSRDLLKLPKDKQYDAINDGAVLAVRLTNELQEVSHDRHLLVQFSPARLPEVPVDGPTGGTPPGPKDCTLNKVERLPGNVGYIKFDAFVDSDDCAATAAAALKFLEGIDALIFDLRDNHGGGGAVGTLMMSYLFGEPVHFNDFWDRTNGKTTQQWTLAQVPGKRLEAIPVYILTSRSTFSAAEWFTYSLQALKRATVVGEVTGGGAHIVNTERIDDRFSIRVPFGRPINPITGSNWEGVGVMPDVKASASEALDVAQKLAAGAHLH